MKIKKLRIIIGLMFSAVLYSYAENWTIEPGYRVKNVIVDMRSSLSGYPSGTTAKIIVSLKDTTAAYFYYYDAGSSTAVAKSNQFLSTLLTAKSADEKVFIFWYQNALSGYPTCPSGQFCFTAVQNGSN